MSLTTTPSTVPPTTNRSGAAKEIKRDREESDLRERTSSTDSESDSASSNDEVVTSSASKLRLKPPLKVRMVPSIPRDPSGVRRSISLNPQYNPSSSVRNITMADDWSESTPQMSNCRKRAVTFSHGDGDKVPPIIQSTPRPRSNTHPQRLESRSRRSDRSKLKKLDIDDDENAKQLHAEWVALRRRQLGLDAKMPARPPMRVRSIQAPRHESQKHHHHPVDSTRSSRSLPVQIDGGEERLARKSRSISGSGGRSSRRIKVDNDEETKGEAFVKSVRSTGKMRPAQSFSRRKLIREDANAPDDASRISNQSNRSAPLLRMKKHSENRSLRELQASSDRKLALLHSKTGNGGDPENFVRNGDGDVWMEQYVISKNRNVMVHCFRSLRTGRVVRNEPPSGASRVLYLDEINRAEIESMAIPDNNRGEQQQQESAPKPKLTKWNKVKAMFGMGKKI